MEKKEKQYQKAGIFYMSMSVQWLQLLADHNTTVYKWERPSLLLEHNTKVSSELFDMKRESNNTVKKISNTRHPWASCLKMEKCSKYIQHKRKGTHSQRTTRFIIYLEELPPTQRLSKFATIKQDKTSYSNHDTNPMPTRLVEFQVGRLIFSASPK